MIITDLPNDSAISSNAPSFMTRNSFVPLARRPVSPTLLFNKRGAPARTSLMKSQINLQEIGAPRQNAGGEKDWVRTSPIKRFCIPRKSMPDPTLNGLSNSQKIKAIYPSNQARFEERHREVYTTDPSCFRRRSGSLAAFGKSIKTSAVLLRKDGIQVLPSIQRKTRHLRESRIRKHAMSKELEMKRHDLMESTLLLRSSQSEHILDTFAKTNVGNRKTCMFEMMNKEELLESIRGKKHLFQPEKKTSRSNSFRTGRSGASTGRSLSFTDISEPEYVFPELNSLTLEDLLLILNYQFVIKEVAREGRKRVLKAEARLGKPAPSFYSHAHGSKYDHLTKYGRIGITNLFHHK